MSKALVIKNASFLTNKLTTVTFNDVSCTGVSFSQSSISLGTLGEANIQYTISPPNTTDEPMFESSDSTVIDFTDGVAVVNGIGTCILTIRCGAYMASCTVTVDIYENSVLLNSYLSSNTDGQKTGYRINSNASRTRLICCDLFSKGYFEKEYNVQGSQLDVVGGLTAIKIPMNTNIIHIECKCVSSGADKVFVSFTNANESFTISNYEYIVEDVHTQLTYKSSGHGYGYVSEDVEVPANISGYILLIYPGNPISSESFAAITTEAALKTFVDTNMELSIHYLH